jgi:hypothetical protein
MTPAPLSRERELKEGSAVNQLFAKSNKGINSRLAPAESVFPKRPQENGREA